mgnify:CR=1 FL=1
MSDPWARLQSLEPFFAVSSGDASDSIRPLLESLADFRQFLLRRERQITFFGAFKAGKSTLLNALIGAALLPTRTNRATGVVTIIQYGTPPSATVIRKSSDDLVEEAIPFDDMSRVILLDLSGGTAPAPGDIEEVRIRVPLPFLVGQGAGPEDGAYPILVDTPGLLEQEALTERSYAELGRSDLAVMVLSADKILSSRERDTARFIHDLLNGNVVFVLNRLDLVEEDDREEVLDWTRTALQGAGNELVGMPRIFATAAKGASGIGQEGNDLAAFRQWLAELFTTSTGDRVAMLSRLGILEQLLCRLDASIRMELTAAQEATQIAREEEAATLGREKAEIKGHIAQCRVRLQTCKDEVAAAGERFVAACVEGTRQQLKQQGRRQASVQIFHQAALERYTTEISENVRQAVMDAPITIPDFELKQWILRAEVTAATQPASDIGAMFGGLMTRVVDGGSAGREAGASVGDWIGKNVFGIDAERETLKRVEGVARGVLPSLQAEAERYVEKVDALLTEADAFYSKWTRTAPRVAAAQEVEHRYGDLVRWCEEFLQEVRAIAEAMAGDT